MQNEYMYLNTDTYHEYLQHQSYVDETQYNHPLKIFELISSPTEDQSKNIPHSSPYIEIHEEGGGDDPI